MSLTRKIAGHSFWYVLAQLFMTAAAIVSMRVLTHRLSQDDYGLMNVINVTVLLATVAFTGGLRHSIARFYGEYRRDGRLAESVGTYLVCSFALALVGAGLVAALWPALVALGVVPAWALSVALLATPLVLTRLGFSAVGCIYRMREQVVTYNAFEVANKYISTGLCIWFVITASPKLFQYYRGLVLGEVVVFALVCLAFFIRPGDLRAGFSKRAASGMFGYGVPLMLGSLASTVFQMGDRYVINQLLGPARVAQYSIPCQLASYTCGSLVAGFEFALVPVIMNAWGAGERARAQVTLTNLIRYYALAAFPMTAGLVAVSGGLVRVLAPEPYVAPAQSVMPYVALAASLLGFVTPLLIGFQFAKKTRSLAALAASMAVLSIILNVILLPLGGPFGGIAGAGIAALTCALVYIVLGHLLARKHCPVVIPWRNLVEYAAAALVMYLCVIHVHVGHWIAELAARVAVGVVIYAVLVLLLDRPLREYVVARLRATRQG